ncbi:hypothetical protein [Streptomyces sp. S.PB5]|uniref:hypothetical protein n=1 Tax=Streptomyces sp. S.PB5 TaxID=3020844 RepID=UPI0025B009F6|nr:hypothetical protein [Streptomyces sp. S.PB5]MDN3021560.1 hypothetical protein [Streptomyces sp. S.PB5]
METRAVPTPGDVARGRTRPAPIPTTPPPSYDRHLWEQALLAAELPHSSALLLGWGLAHLAGTTGYLSPAIASEGSLAGTLRLTARQVRMSLPQLQSAGLIRRPRSSSRSGAQTAGRPVVLTLPPADARTEPPHTGEVPK